MFGLKHALARETLRVHPEIRGRPLFRVREQDFLDAVAARHPRPAPRRRHLGRAAPQPARLPPRPSRRVRAHDGRQGVADVGVPVPRHVPPRARVHDLAAPRARRARARRAPRRARAPPRAAPRPRAARDRDHHRASTSRSSPRPATPSGSCPPCWRPAPPGGRCWPAASRGRPRHPSDRRGRTMPDDGPRDPRICRARARNRHASRGVTEILCVAMRGDSLDVLVTGGAGFIGSHVVDRLLAGGHRPRIFDLRPSPWHARRTSTTCIGDLGDVPRLRSAMAGCDAVIHLAAAADVDLVRADPLDAERRNARGTLNVLEAARADRRRPRRSTPRRSGSTPTRPPSATRRRSALCAPAHLYTATKLAGELYCRSYGELYGARVHDPALRHPLRPARPAGRASSPPFVGRALAGEPLTIAGDGPQSRRFVYVEDLADGVVRALAPAAANRTYNLVGSEDTTHRATSPRRSATLVGDVEIERVPGPRRRLRRRARQRRARRRASSGWAAQTPFATASAATSTGGARRRPRPRSRRGRACAARSGRCCGGRRSRWSPPPRSR